MSRATTADLRPIPANETLTERILYLDSMEIGDDSSSSDVAPK